MATGVSITYGDIAPEAKENFTPTASEQEFDTLGNLQKYNMQLYNYANPCEMYQTLLDGSAVALPDNANIGLWSEQLSNDDGTFTEPITVTLESEGQYSSRGFTFTFDKFNDIYPTRLNIKWYRVTSEGIELLSDTDFAPNSGYYFCRQQVEYFNKVIITFYSLNMPQNRLKVEVIDYGYGTIFFGDELEDVKCIQELNLISTDILSNTCDFILNSRTDMEYSFQQKQPLTVYHNNKLIATTLVTKSTRTGKHKWEVQSQDYIQLMEKATFVGDVYTNKNAYDLLVEIFNIAKVPYEIDENIKQITLNGYIPYTTCREALRYVAFAIQYIVDTSNSQVVKVFKLNEEVSQTVELDRIMQGQKFENSDTVTEVTLDVYTYSKGTEKIEAYNAENSGTGENIFIKFSEPLYDLSISNGTFVKDENGNDKKGTNYAYINANAGCILSSKKYDVTTETKQLKNEKVLASEADNIIEITNNTLISSNNADMVLQKCYDYYMKTQKTNLTIIDNKQYVTFGEPITWGQFNWGQFNWGGYTDDIITYAPMSCIGDNIISKTEYLGDITGTIIKQTFSLNGNNINKESIIV